MNKNILITGAAGFIGYHLSNLMVNEGTNIVGIDNLNDYYDVQLKNDRLKNLENFENFNFFKVDLANYDKLSSLFISNKIDIVIHLAAQAGVRYSLQNPHAYINSNIVGFINLLEVCRSHSIRHLIYASSSSVYGSNVKQPFSETHNVDHPVSLYAATKKSNELMAHTYSSLFKIPTTGLRFFTVYGPWGRPDMAYYSFTKAILEGKPIDVFNDGHLERDFTYIDDIVVAIKNLIEKIPEENDNWDKVNADPATSFAPFRIFNIGNNKPVKLMDFITTLEKILNKKAEKNFLPMQPGDVYSTYANIDLLNKCIGYNPTTKIEEGLRKFVQWYLDYYRI